MFSKEILEKELPNSILILFNQSSLPYKLQGYSTFILKSVYINKIRYVSYYDYDFAKKDYNIYYFLTDQFVSY